MTQEADQERCDLMVIKVMGMLMVGLLVGLGRWCWRVVAIAKNSKVCGRVEKVGEGGRCGF